VVFELVSRTDRKWEARERIASFISNGAKVVVLIDPYAQEIEVNGERKPWAPVEIFVPGCREPFLLDPAEMD
jgi:fructoselysine-6-P-deglycase FrlB-like protein